ncbi:MAG TPA: pyridoxamine 5'-phosphate oxidase family protein [Ferrovibrio sp.]|jgi:general stress protein 26|uniref:pyridoxamine 5'-phosphate oxidase family protein n=1 Tax=Ferrovibrio sp. TaxID=1917215 RepID=UPI002ED2047A
MPNTENGHNVARLLAGAAKTVQSVRYCWLVTAPENGIQARPMGRIASDADISDWTIRFVTNGRSRKAAELDASADVTLIFQDDAKDASAVLSGQAALLADEATFRRHWKDAYSVYFPTAEDRAAAAFIAVTVLRMELWIRGVTSEPFGLHATVLERDGAGEWRLKPSPALPEGRG